MQKDQAVQYVVEQIWKEYDIDRSGELDKNETRKFMKDFLAEVGAQDEYNDLTFNEIFN